MPNIELQRLKREKKKVSTGVAWYSSTASSRVRVQCHYLRIILTLHFPATFKLG